MKKVKKIKTPQRRTELDQIAAQIRTALRSQIKNVIEVGNLLIKSRKHLNHGDWQAWLAKNFDLSLRTAQNYYAAADYVARAQSKSATVADFANLSATVLYRLAEGGYTEQAEAEILAQAKAGKRIDEDRAWAICEALAPPDDDDDDNDDDDDDDDDADDVSEPPEITAILDGPPPGAPPPAPNPPPTDFALRDFDQAIGALKRLLTKPSAQFAQTIHSADDLESIEAFIHAVTKVRKQ
jgi:hypothetical protein